MKKFLAFMAMTPGFSAIVVWIYVIAVAQKRDWLVTLDFKKFGEGILERNLLVVSALAWIAGFVYLVRRV